MTHRVEKAGPAETAELISLWNTCRGSSHPMTERLMHQQLEGAARVGRLVSLIVREGGRIAGWALVRASYEPDAAPADARMLVTPAKGGLCALCVAPDARHRGIGRTLLAAAEAQLKAWGLTTIMSTMAPFHLLPGVPVEAPEVDALLERNGWTFIADCIDLDSDVSRYEPLADATARRRANPEVDFRPVREGEERALHDMVAREFPGSWEFIVGDHLAQGGSRDDLIVAVEAGTILGFCQVHDERSFRLGGSTLWHPLLGAHFGGLGPIGIARDQRKRGLGLALLDAALQHQRRRGVQRMVIDWTTLEEFYGKVGFKCWRRYRQWRKTF